MGTGDKIWRNSLKTSKILFFSNVDTGSMNICLINNEGSQQCCVLEPFFAPETRGADPDLEYGIWSGFSRKVGTGSSYRPNSKIQNRSKNLKLFVQYLSSIMFILIVTYVIHLFYPDKVGHVFFLSGRIRISTNRTRNPGGWL